MKILSFTLLALSLLSLTSCAGYDMALGADALGIYLTRDEPGPPADQSALILPHNSWCYATMGYPECYSTAQPGAEERLINVDPESSYPLDTQGYIRASNPRPIN